jgi:signal transduction histidine kinase/DNA-binding NarL/FixJ family response regulator
MHKDTIKEFFILLLLLTLALGGMVVFLYPTEGEDLKKIYEINEVVNLNIGKQIISNELESIVTDLLVLAEHSTFSTSFKSLNQAAVKLLARYFLVFSQKKRLYAQVRFIDQKGMEIVRVNFNAGQPAIVPNTLLQNKAQRYYFGETMRLEKGQIYVSPFDFNIEGGEVEKTFKTMVRFGTPVFDAHGEKMGIIILNYFGSKLLDHFEKATTKIADHTMLLNADGFLLYNPYRSERDWGDSFEKKFPHAWKKIAQTEAGQFYDADGLFSFNTVYPLLEWQNTVASKAHDGEITGKEYYWKIVAWTPSDKFDFNAAANQLLWKFFRIIGPLFILLALGNWLIGVLAEKVERRTAVFRQANKELARASRLKDEFMANMSHELRTPLNGILGYTQILIRDSTLTDKQKQGIQIIHRSGEHLLMLINDILDLSKIEADKLELMPKDFRFPEFLKDIVDLFRMRAKQKGIEFVYEQGAQLPATVHADEKRLRQVLLNLLSNAIKFTQQGRVSFKVSPISSQIDFSVTDSGEGIAAENLETIFLPFQQVGAKNDQEGAGLGLAISKRLVNMMGGDLQVESVLGSGSRFWFKIPLPESKATLPQSPPPQPTIIGFKTTTNEVFRILVVDDKWENRVILTNLLIPLGFNVLEASDGQEALTKAKQFYPDVIIMDIKMPVMDGLECTRRLRQNVQFEKTVIIALSATVFELQRQECFKLGCNVFLEKPINTDTLLQILAERCPIEWVYEKPVNKNENSPAQIIPPNEEQTKALFKLAKYGDVQAVIKEAEALLESEPHLQAFVGEVCQLAKGFKITQLKKFLEQFLVQDKSCTPDKG